MIVAILAGALAAQDPYPLSQQLRVLEQDLDSPDYQAVLATMIPTDLEAEWQRVAAPDNYHVFARQHGGMEAVAKDPEILKAFERRKKIATRFLEMMRAACVARKKKPPFDDEAVLTKALERGDRRGGQKPLPDVRILPVFPAAGAEKQWPAFRGPTGRCIVFDARLPATWDVLWKTKLPGRGNSSTIIWGDKLFVTSEGPSAARLLLCYDRRDGKLLWQLAAPTPKEAEKLWPKNTYASSTPVTDGERVIAFFGNGGLLAGDFEGKQLWHRDLGLFPTMHGPGASPVLYKDLVILIQDQNKGEPLCAAFDTKTGEVRWRRERKNVMCWASPVLLRIDDRDELVFNGSHEVVSYDPATGEVLWKAAGPSQESIPMIAAGGGLLYSVSGRNGPMFALRTGGKGDVTDTHVVWRNERGGPHVTSPAYHDGRLYVVSDTGVLGCLDAATGSTLYQERLKGRFSASPLVVGDLIIFLSEDGLATILKSGPAFQRVAEHDLGEPTLATPAVLGGRIYFRTAENLICIGEK
jgi:outer membrane protein assembly factor BamB